MWSFGGCPDALAFADAVDAPRFIVVGVSTGGGYALALAAHEPARVIGVVACCAPTDSRDDVDDRLAGGTPLHIPGSALVGARAPARLTHRA